MSDKEIPEKRYDLILSKDGLHVRRSIWRKFPAVVEWRGSYAIMELGLAHVLRALWCLLTLRNYTIVLFDKAKIVKDETSLIKPTSKHPNPTKDVPIIFD